jgi:hypothetical protein
MRPKRTVCSLLALLAACAIAPTLNAHPIHTTYALLSVSGATGTLELRAFADDFSAAVARFHGRPAPRDSVVSDADSYRYLAQRLTLTTPSGATLPLIPCGVRRAANLYWICWRVPQLVAGMRATNRVLAELHADQVNIVQLQGGGAVLFTRSSGAQALGL